MFCRSRFDANYWQATVKFRRDDQLLLEYEGGDTEWTVVAWIRMPAPSDAPTGAPATEFYSKEQTPLIRSALEGRFASADGRALDSRRFQQGDHVFAPRGTG